MIKASMEPPANDPGAPEEDVRDRLRRDHDVALAELELLRDCDDERACEGRLRELRQSWIIHALAEETVVYRALESANAAPAARADERFIEHELVGHLFDKLGQTAAGSLEWKARVNVVADLIARHIETEHRVMFAQLSERFSREELAELGRRFESARGKLTMLEQAKAA